MREPTVAAGFARALLELAVQKGASREALIARSGIDPELLGDQDNRVPLPSYVKLMRAGKELSGDPALALHFGESFDISELSIVGLIGRSCETVAEAFAQLNRYARLVIEVDLGGAERYQLRRENGDLWLIDTRASPNDFLELTESSFARMAARRMEARPKYFRAVHFTHAEPGYRAEYERIFDAPIVFESDRNALLMTGEDWMTLKPPQPSRYVFGVLSARAEALLQELQSSHTTRGHVEHELMPLLHTGDVSMDTVAGKLGVSRQTLLRRLKAEGVTFEKVLDELRRRLALDYLNARKVSVNETAYLVGFSDPAAFSRAFKRWTGKSPRDFKRQAPP